MAPLEQFENAMSTLFSGVFSGASIHRSGLHQEQLRSQLWVRAFFPGRMNDKEIPRLLVLEQYNNTGEILRMP